MTSRPTVEVDLGDPGFVDDPYPTLAGLRAAGPMVWHDAGGRWLATTHGAVTATLRDRRLGRIWTDWEPVGRMEPFNALHRNQLMENEPPVHTRMRRLLAGAFSRGHVERMRPRIEELATEMAGRLDGTVDLLADYAEPMPVYVIADLLGVPRSDHTVLRDWSQAIVHMYEPAVDESVRSAAVSASVEFDAYVRDVLQHRRRTPGDDLITDLLAERADGESLSEDELVATVVLLLNAGHEASVNVFGNGVHALLEHPAEVARVAGGEVPVDVALEELIRFDAPLQLFERTATADVEIAGQRVVAGEKVACLMGSANRDAAVFDDPDRFDPARDPNPHVGFGLGPHFCLGAPLARLELQISLAALLRRHPRLTLAGTSPRRPTWVLRGYRTLVVDLEGSS
ncbi:unspecific monooxygenase [Aeromicrobium marinum DSM 15272]|uniref:Unspecific monooxygenase n=1 Tax=Aeromicrobium marinum DSM 15272 TaxID=585531 RepID=E2SFT6_9ACTN|nr:cytochrome P450 [Aeromicrobium marinum]EFQ81883.1 unspecific monooxygenase [Aeromicrobium marinum DSM 15272]